jgi:site-specific DNA recombinase
MRAAIYVRVSSQGQADGASLPSQEAAARDYAERHGYTVAHIYREVHTGTELYERPQMTLLREGLRAKQFDTIICHSVDRLSRDPLHLGTIIGEAENVGVTVQFVTEPLDSTPEGMLVRYIVGYAGKVEHQRIKERTERGKRQRLESGRLSGYGTAPFGYRWGDDDPTDRRKRKTHLVLDEATAPIAARMFAMAAEGHSLGKIVHWLAEQGIPTPKGNATWTRRTLHGILKNPAYTGTAIGQRRQHVTERRQEQNRRYAKKASDKVTVNHDRPLEQQVRLPDGVIPPIVDLQTFEAVAQRLKRNQAESSRNSSNPEAFLLRAGFVVCGYCGAPLTARMLGTLQSRKSAERVKRAYYAHPPRSSNVRQECGRHNSILAEEVDRQVWEDIWHIIEYPETLIANAERAMADDPTAADLAALDRQLASFSRQLDNLTRAVGNADDDDVRAALMDQLKLLTTNKRQAEAERATLGARQSAWQANRDGLGGFVAFLRNVRENWRTLDYLGRRRVLAWLQVKVRLYDRDADPRWTTTADISFSRALPTDLTRAHCVPSQFCEQRRCFECPLARLAREQ